MLFTHLQGTPAHLAAAGGHAEFLEALINLIKKCSIIEYAAKPPASYLSDLANGFTPAHCAALNVRIQFVFNLHPLRLPDFSLSSLA